MADRIISAPGGSLTPAGVIPCNEARWTPSDQYGQSGVRMNETMQIVFGGAPPYNLTQTICDKSSSSCWCGVTMTNLTSSTFNWTVSTIQGSPSAGQPQTLFVGNHSMVWIAIQQNRTADNMARYYLSRNYSLSDRSYDLPPGYTNPPASAGSLRMDSHVGLIGWAVLCLATLSVLAGV